MKNFAEVLARAAQIGPLPLVLAAAQDEEALRALKAACEAGLAQPMLVGDEALIRPLLVRVGLPSSIPVVHEPDPALAAVAAAKATAPVAAASTKCIWGRSSLPCGRTGVCRPTPARTFPCRST